MNLGNHSQRGIKYGDEMKRSLRFRIVDGVPIPIHPDSADHADEVGIEEADRQTEIGKKNLVWLHRRMLRKSAPGVFPSVRNSFVNLN